MSLGLKHRWRNAARSNAAVENRWCAREMAVASFPIVAASCLQRFRPMPLSTTFSSYRRVRRPFHAIALGHIDPVLEISNVLTKT